MKFSGDFECGNGTEFQQLGKMRWRFRTRSDGPGYGHFFCFRMTSEGESGQVDIEILTDPPAEPEQQGRPEIIWRRKGTDGPWERMEWEESFTSTPRSVRIGFDIAAGDTWEIAESRPLPYSDIARHMEEMPAYCGWMSLLRLGETPEGRPLLCARLTDRNVPEAEKGRVFILAGQHGTEFAGSFAAKGILDFLASAAPQAAALRRHYVIDILPCANPDGNAHGLGRFNSEGKDQHSSFAGAAGGTQPETAEAAVIWQHLEENPPDLILNFHSYAHRRLFGDPPYEGLYIPDPESLGNPARREHQRALNHALFYLTAGGTQHGRPCPMVEGTLEENAAMTFGSVTALYCVQSEQGAHDCMLTGINVLQAAIDTLELAQQEQEGL